MMVTDRLVFLHLQKTGGSFVQRVLSEHFGARQIGLHNRLEALGDPGKRLVAGSVRNPWDWYVSLFTFGCRKMGDFRADLLHGAAARAVAPACGTGATVAGVASLCYKSPTPANFRRWLRLILHPEHARVLGEGYDRFSWRGEMGFYTHRYLRLFLREASRLSDGSLPAPELLANQLDGWVVVDRMLRTESLVDDLVALLREVEAPLAREKEAAVRHARRVNVSRNDRGYRDWFDGGTIDLVAEREQVIIRRHGYSFGEP